MKIREGLSIRYLINQIKCRHLYSPNNSYEQDKNVDFYIGLKTARWGSLYTDILDNKSKLFSNEILCDFIYKKGAAGYKWISQYLDIPKNNSFKMNRNRFGIVQYHNKFYVNKIVKAHSIDKNGAYAWWLMNAYLPGEQINEYEDNCIVAYRLTRTGELTFDIPVRLDFTPVYFRGFKLDKEGKFLKYYNDCLKENKKMTKILINAGIGYIYKKINPLIVSYIWFKQGEEISKIRSDLINLNCDVIKIHTDSISWVAKESSINYTNPTYKIEKVNTNLHMINAAVYQWEGSIPSGIVAIPNKDMLEYEDGINIDLKTFPCLRPEVRVKKERKKGDIINCDYEFVGKLIGNIKKEVE